MCCAYDPAHESRCAFLLWDLLTLRKLQILERGGFQMCDEGSPTSTLMSFGNSEAFVSTTVFFLLLLNALTPGHPHMEGADI